MYFDYNGASFLMVDGQINAFAQQPYCYQGYTLLPSQQSAIPLLVSTLGLPQAYDCSSLPLPSQALPQPSPSSIPPGSEVDALVDLVSYFNQQEEPSSDISSEQVAELASTLQSSLPSSPSQPPDSPSMQRPQLPSISSLSGELPPLPPVKKQYPSSPYFSASSSRIPVLPSLSLPSLSRSTPAFTKQPESIPSPESDPCASPPLSSPKQQRNKKNYTKEFNIRFHELINNNEHASNEWHLYAQRHKGKCTIKRAPCIKVSRGFCASYAHEFTDLAKEEKYGALGTRTECGCMHKPQPLSSSGPARKQRQPARATPYPSSSPSTPELPSADSSSSLSKQAWVSFLLQSAPSLHEGFNAFMGGMQCATCHARRAFASRDEVIAYLMREPIPCTQECCAGNMQLHQ